jgi:uncharacterized membrane protein
MNTPASKETKGVKAHPPEAEALDGELVVDLDQDEEQLGSITSALYQGPLPPPQMLAQYDDVLPGMADRLLKIVEKEQDIRASGQRHYLFNDSGRVLGSILVSVFLVGGAIYCGVIGQPELGIALAASGAAPQIIRSFQSRGASKKSSEEEE